jgi:hypothetical protein
MLFIASCAITWANELLESLDYWGHPNAKKALQQLSAEPKLLNELYLIRLMPRQ